MAVAELPLPQYTTTLAQDLLGRAMFGVTLTLPGRRRHRSRVTNWLHVSARELDAMWPEGLALRTVDMRHPDGKLFLAVEQDEELGYLVRAPRFGRHIVASDGGTITSAVPRIPAWRWERLFLSQVLPLAAALQGLEVFHASAVALGRNVLAFVGISGVGKTSTAAHLVARGADFLTDDVLALEAGADGVVAHPGSPRLAIEAAEVRRIPAAARPRLGELLGTFEKRQYAPMTVDEPRTLALLYFLRRVRASRPAAITPVDEPRRLLGSPFVPHLRSPERLVRHLDVCAEIARTARTFVVDVPPGFQADAVADLTLTHAEAVL